VRGPSPDCHRDQASDVSGYPGVQRTPPHRGIICRGKCRIYLSHADRREACGSAVACFGCVPVFFLHRFNSHTSDSKVRSQLEHYRLRSLAAASATVCAHGKRHQWNTRVTCHVTQTHRTPKYYSSTALTASGIRRVLSGLRSGKRMTMRYDMIETHAQRGHIYMYEDVL